MFCPVCFSLKFKHSKGYDDNCEFEFVKLDIRVISDSCKGKT